MRFSVSIRHAAASDIAAARGWYEALREGLGREFLDAIENTLDRIANGPLRYPIAIGEARRALVPRFPYSIYFRILDSEVRILAVIHQHRDPRIAGKRLR